MITFFIIGFVACFVTIVFSILKIRENTSVFKELLFESSLGFDRQTSLKYYRKKINNYSNYIALSIGALLSLIYFYYTW